MRYLRGLGRIPELTPELYRRESNGRDELDSGWEEVRAGRVREECAEVFRPKVRKCHEKIRG